MSKFRMIFYSIIIIGLLLIHSAYSNHTADTEEKPFQPGQWVELGGSSTEEGISKSPYNTSNPSVAIDSQGNPVVAWSNSTTEVLITEIYVKKWDGNAWVETNEGSAIGGGISNTNQYFSGGDIVVDSKDNLIVAWRDQYHIYVKKWNGKEWVEIGNVSKNLGVISDKKLSAEEISLDLSPDGNPLISWSFGCNGCPGEREIYIRRWNGVKWVNVGYRSGNSWGGISRNIGASTSPSLAVDGNGNPFVSWNDSSSGNVQIYVKHWNGRRWVEVGNNSASNGGVSNNCYFSVNASLAIDSNGYPVVAWSDGNLFLDDKADEKCLKEARDESEIYVKRFNGEKWIEIGKGSAAGAGISNTEGDSSIPSLVLDNNGNPIIAWLEFGNRNAFVYVKCWNGQKWVELGAGSASGNGISGPDASEPKIAIDSSGNPFVVWSGGRHNQKQVFVKKFIADNFSK